MKVTINKDVLFKALDKIAYPALVSNTNPIQNTFLIETDETGLSITTSNVVSFAQTFVKCTVAEQGKVAVLAKPFLDFVKSLDKGDVTLILKENVFQIKQGKIKVNVNIFDEKEYPRPKEQEIRKKFTVSFGEFINQVDSSCIAQGTNVGFNINGILLDIDEKLCYNIVATDGRRAAGFINTSEARTPYVVPNILLGMLRKSGSENSELTISVNARVVMFQVDDTILCGAQIEGKFPDYMKAFTAVVDKKLTIDREVFLGAIKRVSLLLSNELNDSIVLKLKDNEVFLKKANDRSGSIEETIEAKFKGELEIGFNPTFLTCILESSQEDEITLGFSSAEKPMIYNKDKYSYIALPMRI